MSTLRGIRLVSCDSNPSCEDILSLIRTKLLHSDEVAYCACNLYDCRPSTLSSLGGHRHFGAACSWSSNKDDRPFTRNIRKNVEAAPSRNLLARIIKENNIYYNIYVSCILEDIKISNGDDVNENVLVSFSAKNSL